MDIITFLSSNKLRNKSFLEEELGVSRATLNRHQGKETKMMQLALDQLHAQEREYNKVDVEITEWMSVGVTYFSGYVYIRDEIHFLEFQNGYGSQAEVEAREGLQRAKLIPEGSAYDLNRKYNIKFNLSKHEVRHKKDMHGVDDHMYQHVLSVL